MIKKLILGVLFSFILVMEVNAYTKEDIIKLTDNVKICDSETKSLFDGVLASYTRLLNTRNVSAKNIDIIYNNVNKVIGILNKNGLCKTTDEAKISESLKAELMRLFEETNEIILNSPKINVENSQNNNTSNNSNNISGSNPIIKEDIKVETNIVTDSTTNEIKIYEDGVLTEVIKLNNKLNYVGLNKILIITFIVLGILLVLFILLKYFWHQNILLTSFIYVLLLILPCSLIFKDEISRILDYIDLMKLKESDKVIDVLASSEKIINYPSYGNRYGTIYINNEKEDIYFGDNEKILKKGIGQATSSFLPGEGKKTILSGHNTGVFSNLSTLDKNDQIKIETTYGEFKYEVKKIEIVKDSETEILEKKYDLILYTCYPNEKLYGNKRIVIMANLIESTWQNGNIKE